MEKNSRRDKQDTENILSSKVFVKQENPNIKVSDKYINYAEYQIIEGKEAHIETFKNPLINEKDEIIGEAKDTETYYFNSGETKRDRYETIDSEKGSTTVDTHIVSIGKTQLSVQSIMSRRNELTGNTEKAEYKKDKFGNETYIYMENGTIGKKITKRDRGTTIDIFKDGQPYETYEYDENGEALIPMDKVEQLPENYIESIFRKHIPEYYEIVETYNLEETEKTSVNKQVSILDSISNRMGKAIDKMENFNNKFANGLDNFIVEGSDFLNALTKAGFDFACIGDIKSKIKGVNAKMLLAMDKILNRAQEKNIEKEEMKNYGR